jgi:hypothetical protein
MHRLRGLDPYSDVESLRFYPGPEYEAVRKSYGVRIRNCLREKGMPSDVIINGDKLTITITPPGDRRRRSFNMQVCNVDEAVIEVVRRLSGAPHPQEIVFAPGV